MYSAKAVESAAAELNRRRQAALDAAEARRLEVYSHIPTLWEIQEEIRTAAVTVATASITPQGPQAVEKLMHTIQSLQARRVALLAEAGLTPQELEPRYSCPYCEDTGLLNGRRCRCFEELIRLESCRTLPQAAQDGRFSFGSFDLTFYPDTPDRTGVNPRRAMSNIFDQCRTYAETFSAGSPSLLFQGRTGLGKTHLSLAITTRVAERGFSVLYTPAQGLIDRYERLRFDKSPTPQDREFAAMVPQCDLLVLDDLGTEFLNSFSLSVLYSVLNDRILAQRPMILSTNLDPGQLSTAYGERIASRILCECVAYTFYGNDIRLEKRKQELLGSIGS